MGAAMYCMVHTKAGRPYRAGPTPAGACERMRAHASVGNPLTTNFEHARTARRRPAPLHRPQPSRTPPRLLVIEHDPEMHALLRDILADDYVITEPPAPVSIAAIDAEDPDVMLMGIDDGASPSGLTSDEIAALASRHMRLYHVPIVILTADAAVLGPRLTNLNGVTVVSLPFDLDTIRCVLRSVVRNGVHASADVRPAADG